MSESHDIGRRNDGIIKLKEKGKAEQDHMKKN